MKIVIFGATGSVGRLMLQQALAEGYSVTAFVRDPAKLGVDHPHLRIVQGDAMDPAAVADAVRGHDAVVCALGAPCARQERGTSCVRWRPRGCGA